jgi:hypothetical protein
LNDYELRARVEARLRKILDLYSRAHTVSDFKDVILIIHTAIEEVIDREFQTEEKPESFNQKVQAVFPDLYERYNISDVTRLRNHIAHPTRVFQETEVRAAARSFVDFTLAAWPGLFGSLPPLIMHPLPSETPWEVNQPTTADALPYGSSISDEYEVEPVPVGSEPKKKAFTIPGFAAPAELRSLMHLPWHHLAYFFASSWMAVLVIGLMVQISQTSTPSTLLLFGFALLIFMIASLGYLVHFLLNFGIKRIFISILIVVIVTTAVFTIRQPSDSKLGTRFVNGFGMALTRPIFWATQIGILAYESGQNFGQQYFPESRQLVDAGEQSNDLPFDEYMETLFPPTPGSPPQATHTPESIQPAAGIAVGGRVQVETNGSTLRSRDVPGLSGTIVTNFEPGALLQVLDGPVDADGYTWWKVSNGIDTGWSAADFMSPVQ